MGINSMVRCPDCNMVIRKYELKYDGLCPKCSENKQLKWELKAIPHLNREIERLKKHLPFLKTCLSVINKSGTHGYEMKRAIQIVEAMINDGQVQMV